MIQSVAIIQFSGQTWMRMPRRVYLVKYNQADLTEFPTRKGFEKCIKKHFNSGSQKVKVQHWVCAEEKHQNRGENYHVVTKPANNKYTRVGADQSEMIVVQDFRSSSELICWKDLLLLLEGENVKLQSPKNQFATDVYINTETPILATFKTKTEYVEKHNTRDDRETGNDGS